MGVVLRFLRRSISAIILVGVLTNSLTWANPELNGSAPSRAEPSLIDKIPEPNVASCNVAQPPVMSDSSFQSLAAAVAITSAIAFFSYYSPEEFQGFLKTISQTSTALTVVSRSKKLMEGAQCFLSNEKVDGLKTARHAAGLSEKALKKVSPEIANGLDLFLKTSKPLTEKDRAIQVLQAVSSGAFLVCTLGPESTQMPAALVGCMSKSAAAALKLSKKTNTGNAISFSGKVAGVMDEMVCFIADEDLESSPALGNAAKALTKIGKALKEGSSILDTKDLNRLINTTVEMMASKVVKIPVY